MSYKGLLKIDGVIDLDQFWPEGKSDADTVKLKVDPAASFTFQSASGKIVRTKAFTGAWVKTRKTEKGERIPVPVISKKNEITIRLQGIDAPELHYPTTVGKADAKKKNGSFRQFHGGRAAEALRNHLLEFARSGSRLVPFHFETRVDKPGRACDCHGRFIGDILVGLSSGGKSVNAWLVENGWAFPLFYDSMDKPEIQSLIAAWRIGQDIAGRPGSGLKAGLLPFGEENRIEHDCLIPGYPDGDMGPDNFPKIFRRQAAFWVKTAGDLSPARFREMLVESAKAETDRACTLADHLAWCQGGPEPEYRAWAELVGADGSVNFGPTDLVFEEEGASLKKGSAANPKPVTEW